MNHKNNELKFALFLNWLILIFFPWISPAAHADEDLLSSILKFSAGVTSGALIHEGSHALVAGLTDTKMSWKIGTYNQPIGFTE